MTMMKIVIVYSVCVYLTVASGFTRTTMCVFFWTIQNVCASAGAIFPPKDNSQLFPSHQDTSKGFRKHIVK